MNRNEVAKAVVDGAAGSTTAFQDGRSRQTPRHRRQPEHKSFNRPVCLERAISRQVQSLQPANSARPWRPPGPAGQTPAHALSLPALGRRGPVFWRSSSPAPAPRAHAQEPALVEVWFATMTAGTIASSPHGPRRHVHNPWIRPRQGGRRALGRLSADRFELNGMDYVVSHLAYWTRSGSAVSPAHQQLSIFAGNELPTGAVFDLGGTRFPVTNDSRYYSATPGAAMSADHPGLSWSDGDEVTVRLLVPVMTAEVIEAPAFHDGSSVFRGGGVRFSGTLKSSAEEVARCLRSRNNRRNGRRDAVRVARGQRRGRGMGPFCRA